jgi:CelD/BcsL family acetyltransferase involved in cellulose biosynthesis
VTGSGGAAQLWCTNLRDLGDESDCWDELVAAMPVPSAFLRSWWLTAVSDATTSFVLVRDGDGRLVGGLPLRARRRLGTTFLRFAGSGPLCPDHLDVVARPEDADDVAAAITGWLCSQGSVVMELDGLVEDSAAARAWGPARRRDSAPYRRLPTPEDYLAALSSSHRTGLRRASRKLARQEVRHTVVDQDGLGDALAAFERLQAGREGRDHLVAALPVLEQALRAGARRGEVRIDLMAGEQVYAVMVSFVLAGRLSMYQVARSLEKEAAGAGNVLMHEVFQHAAAQGDLVEIDMLRGDEAYKFKFVDRSRVLNRLRWGQGVRARLVVRAWDALTDARTRGLALRQRLVERSGRSRRLAAP